MQRGRRIAFDYGDVRIGVATCDADAIICSPLVTLMAHDKNLQKQIKSIIEQYEPIAIYVGKPSHMDGRQSESAVKASEFAQSLAAITSCPIELIDERLSTVTATRNLRESGMSAKDSRATIDQAAAVAILEFALEIEKNRE